MENHSRTQSCRKFTIGKATTTTYLQNLCLARLSIAKSAKALLAFLPSFAQTRTSGTSRNLFEDFVVVNLTENNSL